MAKILHLRCSGAMLGAENVVMELASSSSRFGHHAIVGVIHDTRDDYPQLATFAKRCDLEHCVFPTSKRFDFGCMKRIRDYVIENHIDIIHTHGYREDIYACLIFSHAKLCATNHLWKKGSFLLKLYAFVDSLVLARFDRVVAVSRPILDEMKRIKYINNRILSLISNGIDTARYRPDLSSGLRDEFSIPDNKLVITIVSSLTKEKGHKYLLTALQEVAKDYNDFVLMIVGNGPMRSEIETLVYELSLSEHVYMLGTRYDIQNIHSGTDIFVLPSLIEGLPMALLEAMSCGVACIASSVGDIPRCISDRINGLLFDAGDKHMLYLALSSLLQNESLRTRIGKSASKTIASHFSVDTMTAAYSNIYNELASS